MEVAYFTPCCSRNQIAQASVLPDNGSLVATGTMTCCPKIVDDRAAGKQLLTTRSLLLGRCFRASRENGIQAFFPGQFIEGNFAR